MKKAVLRLLDKGSGFAGVVSAHSRCAFRAPFCIKQFGQDSHHGGVQVLVRHVLHEIVSSCRLCGVMTGAGKRSRAFRHRNHRLIPA